MQMQLTLQWLYAAKWAPNSSKYICNSLSSLRYKLLKNSVAWILSSCHKSIAKVLTGTIGMVMSVIASTNVPYLAPYKDTCLLLVPLRSKCCQLDAPLLMNVIHADFHTVISHYLQNVSTYLFCTAERMVKTIIVQNSRRIEFFSYRRGLNRPTLRLLWLITSAAADVISVPSVTFIVFKYHLQLFWHSLR